MTGRFTVGIVSCIVGAVWVLQGLNIRKGDGMSGHGEWTFFGSLLVIFGVALIVGARRGKGLGDRD